MGNTTCTNGVAVGTGVGRGLFAGAMYWNKQFLCATGSEQDSGMICPSLRQAHVKKSAARTIGTNGSSFLNFFIA